MIYMVGADLESDKGLGTVDLDGIDYEKMDNKNIKVVLIAGGSKEWKNNYIDSKETAIYELTKDGFKKVKNVSIKNMGDTRTFSDYLTYVYDNYKTDKYNLIFWNHGGAIYGSEFDSLYDDNLSLKELKTGFENSPFNKKNKLETVIFRTCLNGTIEVANVFKDYSNYLIASEETTIGTSFSSVLKFINDINISDKGYDIGFKFIDAYKKQVKEYKTLYNSKMGKAVEIYSTYSIVKVSNIGKLTESVNEFFEDIDIASNYNLIAKSRSNMYQYAYTQSDDSNYDMVDLYSLVNNLKNLSSDKASKVLNVFEDTVIYNWATNNSSRGMSIYFPYNAKDSTKEYFLKLYNEFDDLKPYKNFIKDFNSMQTNSSTTYSFAKNKTSIDTSNTNSDFKLELTDEQKQGYAKAEYLVFRDNKDGYFLPVYRGKQVSLNENTLNATIKGKQLKVVSKEYPDQESIFPLFEGDSNDDYIKYNTYVTLSNFKNDNFIIDPAKLTLTLDKKTNNVLVNNIILSKKGKYTPNSIAVDLSAYDTIAFASSKYKILDENNNYKTNWVSNGIIEGFETKVNDFDFKLQNFDDGYDYYCVFIIWDVNNNNYYSKLIKMK